MEFYHLVADELLAIDEFNQTSDGITCVTVGCSRRRPGSTRCIPRRSASIMLPKATTGRGHIGKLAHERLRDTDREPLVPNRESS